MDASSQEPAYANGVSGSGHPAPGHCRVPPRVVQPNRGATGLVVALGVLGVAAGAVLFWFNPAMHGFYPHCVFHKQTGLLCPGCGSLRALHQLLHGNFLEALRLNAMLVVALPPAAWVGVRAALGLAGVPVRPLKVRPGWMWGAFAVLVVFSIVRNLV